MPPENENKDAGVGDLGGFAPENTPPAGDVAGANTQPPAPVTTNVPPTPPASPVVASIAQRLAGEAGAGNQATESGVKSVEPVPFDITKLTHEQLQNLQEMLNATPERMRRKLDKPTARLKVLNGSIVVDTKASFLALVDDEVRQKKVEAHIIPVKLLGSDEYVNIRLTEFRKLPTTTVEILSTRQEDDSYIEGEVFSAERKVMVEMLVKRYKYFFTVQVKGDANAKPFEIDGKMSNA